MEFLKKKRKIQQNTSHYANPRVKKAKIEFDTTSKLPHNAVGTTTSRYGSPCGTLATTTSHPYKKKVGLSHQNVSSSNAIQSSGRRPSNVVTLPARTTTIAASYQSIPPPRGFGSPSHTHKVAAHSFEQRKESGYCFPPLIKEKITVSDSGNKECERNKAKPKHSMSKVSPPLGKNQPDKACKDLLHDGKKKKRLRRRKRKSERKNTSDLTDLDGNESSHPREQVSKLQLSIGNKSKKRGKEGGKGVPLAAPMKKKLKTRGSFMSLPSGYVEIKKIRKKNRANGLCKNCKLSIKRENLNVVNTDCAMCKDTHKVIIIFRPEDLKNHNLRVSFEKSNGNSAENVDVSTQTKDTGLKTVSDNLPHLSENQIPLEESFNETVKDLVPDNSDMTSRPVSETNTKLCVNRILGEEETQEEQNNIVCDGYTNQNKELGFSSKIDKMISAIDAPLESACTVVPHELRGITDVSDDRLTKYWSSVEAKLIEFDDLARLKKIENHADQEKSVVVSVDPQDKETELNFHIPINFNEPSKFFVVSEVYYVKFPELNPAFKRIYQISPPKAETDLLSEAVPSGSNDADSENESLD